MERSQKRSESSKKRIVLENMFPTFFCPFWRFPTFSETFLFWSSTIPFSNFTGNYRNYFPREMTFMKYIFYQISRNEFLSEWQNYRFQNPRVMLVILIYLCIGFTVYTRSKPASKNYLTIFGSKNNVFIQF